MAEKAKSLRVGVIRARKIEARTLQVGRQVSVGREALVRRVHRLSVTVRELRHALRALRHEVHAERRELERQIEELRRRVARLEREVVSDLPPNPALEALFAGQIGQTVSVSTASGTLTGTVVVAGTNAVELRENTGDILIIPYSKITSTQ